MAIWRPPILAMILLLVSLSASAPPSEDGTSGGGSLGQQTLQDGLHVVSGDSQGALPGSSMPDPLTVVLIGNGTPLAGETVRFAILGNGSATLAGGGHAGPEVETQTDADGQATATLTAGPAEGEITVTATWKNESVPLTCHSVALAPVLRIRGDNRTGVNIMFDARASGTDLGYIFDFGDGSTSGLQVSPTTLHQYSEPGRYTIKLTVFGPYGVNNSAHEDIRISEDADAASLDPLVAWTFLVVALLLLFASLYLFSRILLRDAMARTRSQDHKAGEDKYDMAVSLALAGESDRALKYFQEVLEDDPGNPNAHFYKGVVLMDKNRLRAARRSFSSALEHDPGHEQAKKALEAVDTALGHGKGHAGKATRRRH